MPPRARLETGISVARCLDIIEHGGAQSEASCPGFLLAPLTEARTACLEAGGRLHALPQPEIWAIDVNSDNAPEYAFEYEGVVSCEDAWSLFSCGSLGCPKGLYQQREGAWHFIGRIWGSAPAALEVLATPAGPGNRDLRIGCGDAERCNQYGYLQWTGQQYEDTHLEVRGHRVETADSIHGLYGLVGATDVLSTPTADGEVIGHYGAETDVAIIGTAAAADYYYVSPCNACDSGFIPKAAVRPLQP